MRRMKKGTKRKIAAIIAGFMALAMLLSAISVVTGITGSIQHQNTEATTINLENS